MYVSLFCLSIHNFTLYTSHEVLFFKRSICTSVSNFWVVVCSTCNIYMQLYIILFAELITVKELNFNIVL